MVTNLRPGFVSWRRMLLDAQLRATGIQDERLIDAVASVPRELFVSRRDPEPSVHTPCDAARLVQAVEPRPTDRVLVIGAGSGYAAAVLSRLCTEVFALDADADRAEAARERLEAFGYARITLGVGDGTSGWPEHAPFDAILVAVPGLPISARLLAQLAPGGRIVTCDGLRLA